MSGRDRDLFRTREERLERQLAWLRDERRHLERVGDLNENVESAIDQDIFDLEILASEERDRQREVPNDWEDWERRADERVARFDLDRTRILLLVISR